MINNEVLIWTISSLLTINISKSGGAGAFSPRLGSCNRVKTSVDELEPWNISSCYLQRQPVTVADCMVVQIHQMKHAMHAFLITTNTTYIVVAAGYPQSSIIEPLLIYHFRLRIERNHKATSHSLSMLKGIYAA